VAKTKNPRTGSPLDSSGQTGRLHAKAPADSGLHGQRRGLGAHSCRHVPQRLSFSLRHILSHWAYYRTRSTAAQGHPTRPLKKSSVKRGCLLAAVVLILAGCGGSSARPPHTTTISAAQAAAQEKAAANWQPGQPVPPAPSGPYVVECGGGLSTNGSCVFAEKVKREYAPSITILVGSNPVACSAETAGAWRCRSKLSAVWVQQR
jgi:hypothetical protein